MHLFRPLCCQNFSRIFCCQNFRVARVFQNFVLPEDPSPMTRGCGKRVGTLPNAWEKLGWPGGPLADARKLGKQTTFLNKAIRLLTNLGFLNPTPHRASQARLMSVMIWRTRPGYVGFNLFLQPDALFIQFLLLSSYAFCFRNSFA